MPLPNKATILGQVTRKRFRADQLQRLLLLGDQQKAKQVQSSAAAFSRPKEKFWTGIYQGNFYRIKIPPKTITAHKIPKLHTPTSAPLPLKTVSHHHHHRPKGAAGQGDGPRFSSWWDTLHEWTRKNATILILNFGSICTLVGFTRSDVLELRLLSVTGSICGMIFHAFTPPLRWTPIAWSALFAAVNSAKIYEVVQERAGSVKLSAEQEQRYSEFFMQHGITPKQFEAIDGRAKILCVKKNQVIVRKGEVLQHVYLIVKGQTRATVLGRFLTAASFRPEAETSSKQTPKHADHRATAGAAGAWIGEMALLEHVWNEEVKHSPKRKRSERATGSDEIGVSEKQTTPEKSEKKTKSIDANNTARVTSTADNNEREQPIVVKTTRKVEAATATVVKENSNMRAMYTIVAQDDCTVLVWSHAEMKTLMAKSPDMKAALTRAMTAAIVGKVVTFTTSRSSGRQQPTWLLSSWLLSDSSSALSSPTPEIESLAKTMEGAGAAAKAVVGQVEADSIEDDDEDAAAIPKEDLPRYPVRKFK
jgi:CRP-like cAMP-binding protein